MSELYEHTCPFRPGEDIMEMPKTDDPRVAPWIEELKRAGVINEQGQMIRRGTLQRGVCPAGYIWRITIP